MEKIHKTLYFKGTLPAKLIHGVWLHAGDEGAEQGWIQYMCT